jgi:uncharacterized membrane protein (DUF2068 family)
MRGHVQPAATVARLRPGIDDNLGLDHDDHRFVRCLRCDEWSVVTPGPNTAEVLPERSQLPRPRRGKPLEDAVLVRLIAIDRGLHSLVFTALALAIMFVRTKLAGWQAGANDLVDKLNGLVSDSGRTRNVSFLIRQLHRISGLRGDALRTLLIAAVAYAVVEGVEAVGLWLERRWAEYLTVVATAGFLPLEIRELLNRVTVLRLLAFAVNVAVLVYLVWAKRLFGLRGGSSAVSEAIDWDAILAVPFPVELGPGPDEPRQ